MVYSDAEPYSGTAHLLPESTHIVVGHPVEVTIIRDLRIRIDNISLWFGCRHTWNHPLSNFLGRIISLTLYMFGPTMPASNQLL